MDRVDYQSLIVQDLLNDHKDGKLNLNPWYQRRSVWSNAQKSFLINTLFERKPIPALYVRHSIDIEKQRSMKEVVDGQQRSRAIIEYCDGRFSARTLSGLKKTFSQLTTEERERLLLTPLPVGYLLGATDSDVIDIFARINSISKTLNPQEKRNANYGGEFKQFCLMLSTDHLKFWRSTSIFSANDIARMNEVLFVSDIVFNLMQGLSDFKHKSIDDVYKDNEDSFPREQEIKDRWERVFDVFYQLPEEVFKDTIFSRQPIFFSLILCLDAKSRMISPEALEDKLYLIDAEVKDADFSNKDVSAFLEAIKASTQRLKSRQVRQGFLEARL
ncbi:DUF262 domain-containing protein [Alcaligenes faecalis]|uniref:DUF262 domain-containing protein n=1 Tax=Alcaligenes faecalis TaxID=511 RepID=UPI0036538157